MSVCVPPPGRGEEGGRGGNGREGSATMTKSRGSEKEDMSGWSVPGGDRTRRMTG